MTDVDDLKRLPPEERLKKLQEIADQHKKEIQEAQELMKLSEDELAERDKKLEQVPIPQIEAVDIDQLFTDAEKEAWATRRFEDGKLAKDRKKRSGLEEETEDNQSETEDSEETEDAERSLEEELEGVQGLRTSEQQYLSNLTAEQLEDQVYQIQQQYKETGDLNEEQAEKLTNLYQESRSRAEQLASGQYEGNQELAKSSIEKAYEIFKKFGDNL